MKTWKYYVQGSLNEAGWSWSGESKGSLWLVRKALQNTFPNAYLIEVW